MTSELLRCPFCDGEPEIISKNIRASSNPLGYVGLVRRIRCSICKAQSPYGRNPMLHGWFKVGDEVNMVAAWNTRP